MKTEVSEVSSARHIALAIYLFIAMFSLFNSKHVHLSMFTWAISFRADFPKTFYVISASVILQQYLLGEYAHYYLTCGVNETNNWIKRNSAQGKEQDSARCVHTTRLFRAHPAEQHFPDCWSLGAPRSAQHRNHDKYYLHAIGQLKMWETIRSALIFPIAAYPGQLIRKWEILAIYRKARLDGKSPLIL